MADGHVTDRGEVIEIGIMVARLDQLDLGSAQLLVLQFQFDLMASQLVNQLEALCRRQLRMLRVFHFQLLFRSLVQ